MDEHPRPKGGEPVDTLARHLPESNAENDVYLHLRDNSEGLFVKYDWIFLNDRIVFVRMAGIGTFVARSVQTRYARMIGEREAGLLIKRLKDLRRKKASSISDQDLKNIFAVDPRNSQMLYSDMTRVRLQRRLFGGYRLTVVSKPAVRVANMSFTQVSYRKLRHFFRARVGPRFVED